MSRRPRGAGNTRGMRGGGRGGGGIVVGPPALEAPELVPGLMAWYDSRTPAWITGTTTVSGWVSRAGLLGAIPWSQGSATNQPTYALAVPELGGKNALLLDGVNDWLVTSNQNAWTFLHNGTGASVFRVYRMDSTGGSVQAVLAGQNNPVHIGITNTFSTTNAILQVANGVSPLANSWSFAAAAHVARDVSRWQMWGYGAGLQHSRVSGSSLSNPDAVAPSAAPPSHVLRLGSSPTGTSPFKGHIAQEIYYDHVLAAGETSQLAAWAAAEYGVAA